MESSKLIEFVLFGKTPRLKEVKTRLFPDDPQMSLKCYRAFILDFVKRYSQYCNLPVRPLFDFKSHEERDYLLKLLEGLPSLDPIAQEELAFFERLAAGLLKVESPFFYLTGTDLPHFPYEVLESVTLNSRTVTIGPDLDGGFYFLAGPKECAEVFLRPIDDKNILDSLVRNFEKANYTVKLLKPWSDIDTIEDLHWCLNTFSSNDLPHTYEALIGSDFIDQQSLVY